jgi:UDPglucose--hexose-1-phosphate uridylyltransferase
VVIAPRRGERPGAFPNLEPPPSPDELETCPFCAGREDRTPPETLRLPGVGPWRVRVVPNLFPAFARHEVVVHSPEHLRSIGELSDDALAVVAEAWRSRAEEALSTGFPYVHALVNEGRIAGSSLPHTHSQLVWLRESPPAVVAEGDASAVLDGETVAEQGGLVLLCPAGSHVPYEMRIAPVERAGGGLRSPLLGDALALAAGAVRRLRELEAGAPLNLWLHDGPWWHIDLVPRLTVSAGVELGSGIYVNPLPPEEAAQRLRG